MEVGPYPKKTADGQISAWKFWTNVEIWVEIFEERSIVGKKYSTGVATRRMAITIKYGNTSLCTCFVTPL